VRPFPPTITGYVGSIEETKPLVVTCTTTGSRPKATLQWTIGQKDVTSDATERCSYITAGDTYRVTSDLTYSVGRSDNGQVLTCKAVNVAASSGIQTSITLNVTCKLNTVLVTNECNMISELVSTLLCTCIYSITVGFYANIFTTYCLHLISNDHPMNALLYCSCLCCHLYESKSYFYGSNLWWISMYVLFLSN
jgi:hypothetical protein